MLNVVHVIIFVIIPMVFLSDYYFRLIDHEVVIWRRIPYMVGKTICRREGTKKSRT